MMIVGSTEPYPGGGETVYFDREFMCVNSKCTNYADERYVEKVPMNAAAREEMGVN